ncbi:DUF202 domain-containing protein [Nocardioides sp. 1609]|uniref:YidH family protein n=1 Tax=Nocardioides sp. 1609 TaxID=2508327 RepID=UPI00143019E3|nr:DUF202 domain-containing protein [Nocardioides sp. 1609]
MSDPIDPRYLLANERTFLAWIRTALGFMAAGTGLVAVELPWPQAAVRAVAGALAIVAGVCVVLAWRRWRSVEAAILEGRSTPRAGGIAVLAAATGLGAVALTVLILF